MRLRAAAPVGPAPTGVASPLHRRRLLVLLTVLLALFAVVVSKLADVQVVRAEDYREFGRDQRTHVQVIPAERGVIYDRHRVPLAMSRAATSVFVDPALIEDPAGAAALVAPVLGMDPARVEERMRTPGRFAYLDRRVPEDVVARLRELAVEGVGFQEESERFHPSGDLARSLLGKVDVDHAGITGLEAMYDEALTGETGEMVVERNPAGHTIAVGRRELVPAVPGDDLVLTIDRALQHEAERVMIEQVEATEARGGIAIVSRPGTGEVLAVANVVRDPETDQAVPGTNNATLTTAYEPGSVMKVVPVAAAIERGVVSADTVIQVPPRLVVADAVFTDAEPHGGMAWTVSQVMARSSNIGTIQIAQKAGREVLYEEMRRFGFAEPTAVGFPNEQSGSLPHPTDWWDTSLPTIAIGHGISVTPMQMLFAYNVIANDGLYVAPRLVHSKLDADGTEHIRPLDEGRRVLTKETAQVMNLMLREVIEEGTGRRAEVPGYTPAGKTGTSRKQQPNGGYVDEHGVIRYQATFVGFLPAEQPALSIIVIVDEPGTGLFTGGTVAAPAFAELANHALRLLGVPPPRTDGAYGGAPAASSAGSHAQAALRRNPDGRVRGLPAEQEPTPPTTVPRPQQDPRPQQGTGTSGAARSTTTTTSSPARGR